MSTTRFLRLTGRSLRVQQCNVCYRTQLIHSRQLQTSSNKEDSTASVSFDSSTTVKPFSEMPGPGNGIPFFGTFFTYCGIKDKTTAFKLHIDWAEKYGPIYKDTVLGTTRVYVNDPASVEKICRAEGKIPFRGATFEVMEGVKEAKKTKGLRHGLAEMEGEDWHEKRRLYSKRLLRPVEMKNYFNLFSDASLRMVELTEEYLDSNNIVEDQKKLLIRWSMDSFSAFVFGKPLGFMKEPPNEIAYQVDKSMDTVLPDLLAFKSKPKLIQKLLPGTLEAAADKMLLFYNLTLSSIKDTIERSLSSGGETQNAFSFCEYLLGHDNLSVEECATYATDVFGAAYHTTSATMEFLFYLMAKNPEKQEILYNEICEFMPEDGVLDFNSSQRMPYLRASIKESQRVFPAVPFLGRILEEDISLNGYNIPKHTMMILNNIGMSRNEEIYADPLEFRPERWLRTNDSLPNPFAFLPFGTGARSCVGRRIAEGNMYSLAAQFFKIFKIEEALNEVEPAVAIVMDNKQPLKLKLSRRD